jgi:hypothetical protein
VFENVIYGSESYLRFLGIEFIQFVVVSMGDARDGPLALERVASYFTCQADAVELRPQL